MDFSYAAFKRDIGGTMGGWGGGLKTNFSAFISNEKVEFENVLTVTAQPSTKGCLLFGITLFFFLIP